MIMMLTVMMILLVTTVTVMARGAIRNIGNGGIDGGQSVILLQARKTIITKAFFCQIHTFKVLLTNRDYLNQLSEYENTQAEM